MSKKVVILNFSPRNDGNCAKIADFIANAHNRTNVFIYNITAENYSACSGCNYECLKPGLDCPMQGQYRDEVMNAVISSDLAYYLIPNFCGGPNANYYAFNERSVGFFNGNRELMKQYGAAAKKFVIVSNTQSEAFRLAMKQQTVDEPDVLYLKTSKYKRNSIAGDLMDCDEARNDLHAFIAE